MSQLRSIVRSWPATSVVLLSSVLLALPFWLAGPGWDGWNGPVAVPVKAVWFFFGLPGYVAALLAAAVSTLVFGAGETVPGWFELLLLPMRLLPFLLLDLTLLGRRAGTGDAGGSA